MEKLNLQNYKDHGLIIENFINCIVMLKVRKRELILKKRFTQIKLELDSGHGGLLVIPPGGLINQLRAKMTLYPQEQFKE